MKSTIFFASLLFISAFTACEKGPTFDEQLTGNWKSIEVKAGTNDLSGSNTFELSLEESFEFDLDITTIVPITGPIVQSFSGDWKSDKTKHDVTLVYNGTGELKTWEVKNIANNSLTVEMVEDNVRYAITFERQ